MDTSDLGYPKLKRRRRIATPPPNTSSITKHVDVYDQIVTETFSEIKSGKLNIVVDNSGVSTSPTDSQELVDSEHLPAATSVQSSLLSSDKPLSPSECSGPSSPGSPPPPSRPTNHKRKLRKEVKAAFDRLQRSQRLQLEDDFMHEAKDSNVGELCDGGTLAYDLKVRLRLPSGLQKFPMKGSDRLFSLKDQVARLESTSAARVTLFYNDTSVTEEDTVNSLGLTAADIIDVYVKTDQSTEDNDVSAPSVISIKVQGRKGQRDMASIDLEPSQTMDVLMKRFAKMKGLELADICFLFDGEEISSTDTPLSLDIEDGDCIDYLLL